MQEMRRLLETAHSDVASMVAMMQIEEPRRYDEWHWAQAALGAERAAEAAVGAIEVILGSVRPAPDRLGDIIENAEGQVLETATDAQEALNRVWNFRDPLAETVPP